MTRPYTVGSLTHQCRASTPGDDSSASQKFHLVLALVPSLGYWVRLRLRLRLRVRVRLRLRLRVRFRARLRVRVRLRARVRV